MSITADGFALEREQFGGHDFQVGETVTLRASTELKIEVVSDTQVEISVHSNFGIPLDDERPARIETLRALVVGVAAHSGVLSASAFRALEESEEPDKPESLMVAGAALLAEASVQAGEKCLHTTYETMSRYTGTRGLLRRVRRWMREMPT